MLYPYNVQKRKPVQNVSLSSPEGPDEDPSQLLSNNCFVIHHHVNKRNVWITRGIGNYDLPNLQPLLKSASQTTANVQGIFG